MTSNIHLANVTFFDTEYLRPVVTFRVRTATKNSRRMRHFLMWNICGGGGGAGGGAKKDLNFLFTKKNLITLRF